MGMSSSAGLKVLKEALALLRRNLPVEKPAYLQGKYEETGGGIVCAACCLSRLGTRVWDGNFRQLPREFRCSGVGLPQVTSSRAGCFSAASRSCLSSKVRTPVPGVWTCLDMAKSFHRGYSGLTAAPRVGLAGEKVVKRSKKPAGYRDNLKYARKERQRLRLRKEVAIKTVWKTREYVTLLRTILRENGWGAKTIAELEPLAIALNSHRVNLILEDQRDPQVAVKFFCWSEQQEGIKHTLNSYSMMIKMLASRQRHEDMWEFLERKQLEADKLTKLVFAPILRSYGERADVRNALDAYDKLKDLGYFPDVVAYNCLLQMLVRAKDHPNTHRVFKAMVQEGCVPDIKTYTTLMLGLLEEDNPKAVLEMFQKMKDAHCVPYLGAYNSQIRAFIKLDKHADALNVVEEMRKKDLFPDLANCSALVDCHRQKGDFDEACKLLEEMKVKGLVQGVSQHSNIVTCFCEAYRTEHAFILFEDMKAMGFVLDSKIYQTLIDSFVSAGASEIAFKILNEMKGKGFIAEVSSLRNLINELGKAGHVDKAFYVLKEMQLMGVTADESTFNLLIDSFGKDRFLEEALKLLKEMNMNGLVHDTNIGTYNGVLEALVRSGAIEEATSFVQEMKDAGCDPNHLTYDILKDTNVKFDYPEDVQETAEKSLAHP